MSLLNENEKHGFLIFDEMFLRKSISVNSKTLTYSGLEDFGKDESSLNSGEKADHDLVMMFQSLDQTLVIQLQCFVQKGQ